MLVNLPRFQIDDGEGVEGKVSASDDCACDGLSEGAEIESFMTEMSPKVVNHYFIWFARLLKYVPENFSGFILLKWSGLAIVT